MLARNSIPVDVHAARREHDRTRPRRPKQPGDYLRLLDRIEELGARCRDLDQAHAARVSTRTRRVTATHVGRLVERSAEPGRTCWIDMESSAYTEATIDLYETQLRGDPHVGLCLQAYLRLQ